MRDAILRTALTAFLSAAVPVATPCILAASPPADDPLGRAIVAARHDDEKAAMSALRDALRRDGEACQRALLEPAFHDGLRDRAAFREAVHEACVEHGVSELTLVGEDEPGEWIEIELRTVDAAGRPLPGTVIRIFATDAEGRYHPSIRGERTPRIFGTLVSDAEGRATVRTVMPGPYPGTRNPRHLHVSARHGSMRLAAPHYAVFADDPLLLERGNEEPREEALRVEMKSRGDVSRGELVLPLR